MAFQSASGDVTQVYSASMQGYTMPADTRVQNPLGRHTFSPTREAQSIFASSPKSQAFSPPQSPLPKNTPPTALMQSGAAIMASSPTAAARQWQDRSLPAENMVPDGYTNARASAGLGYGTRHTGYFSYLQSKDERKLERTPIEWDKMPFDLAERTSRERNRRFDLMRTDTTRMGQNAV